MGREHLDQHLHHRGRRVELAALLALGAGELAREVLIDLAQQILPSMRRRKRGWILNVSSAVAAMPAGPPFDEFAVNGGALLYGLTKAALDRFSVGLAAETYEDGIAVNSLSPVAAVRTPGAEALHMLPDDRPELIEPLETFVEAAIALCTCDPRTMTGRIAFSRPLLAELGRAVRTLDGRDAFLDERAETSSAKRAPRA